MPLKKFTDAFASNIFTDDVMRERLPKAVYQQLQKTMQEGSHLDIGSADVIAKAMMEWALEHGVTHYTHWFQPLTGITAEKHDSFITRSSRQHAICEFSGKALIKGEPDASSFPSGGLRATFEARGYTAWDCTSPAFIKEDASGPTLCIPTAFCSYTGMALDKKTPLLRSMQAINKQAMRVLRLIGNTTSERVTPSCGAEQEYFLVDKAMYNKRADLVFTGRTLFGSMPPKGQEMDDHYFGVLKERVAVFMKDLDTELWKMGVYSKTKHNEVAPGQHELAPLFDDVNVATDHNQIIMETMRKLAKRHGFECLLHEKPFAGINGSGKHDNWSLDTNDGINLLDPGKAPHENLQFLLFTSAIIKAIDDDAQLLRASAASAGNDHRLGKNEAPPAIISIYMGDDLTSVFENIAQGGNLEATDTCKLKIGVKTLPEFAMDTADRNRTSPFAFTGNKFEFRMVPSSASVAGPNTIINTIVAESLCYVADRLEQAKDINAEIIEIIKDIYTNHKRIIFNGNGYTKEWEKEAEKRGLPNINNSVDAFKAFVTERAKTIFAKHKVYSEAELNSRFEIKLEKYIKVLNIEASTMLKMVKREILPACINYSGTLAKTVNELKAAGCDINISAQASILTRVNTLINQLFERSNELEKAINKMHQMQESDDLCKTAEYCRDDLSDCMQKVREYADELECIVDRSAWPFPTYDDLLFGI